LRNNSFILLDLLRKLRGHGQKWLVQGYLCLKCACLFWIFWAKRYANKKGEYPLQSWDA